jgi:hypothetical protein
VPSCRLAPPAGSLKGSRPTVFVVAFDLFGDTVTHQIANVKTFFRNRPNPEIRLYKPRKLCYISLNCISQSNDRGAASISNPGEEGSKAVAGAKGAAAEGEALRAPPGQPENIRLTVAFAERYGLIAELPRSAAEGGTLGAFRDFGSCAVQAAFFVAGDSAGDRQKITEE